MERTDRTEKNNEKWFKGAAFEGAMDPEFTDIARGFLCGDVLSRGCLTDRQRALVTLTALTTCQTLDNMAAYTEAALGAGATPEEIKETLYQCTPYIGMERVWAALKEVNKAFQAAGIKEPCRKQGTVTEETRFEKGLAVQQEIFGADHIHKMRDAAPEELKHIQD